MKTVHIKPMTRSLMSLDRVVSPPQALAKFHQRFAECRTRVIPGLSMESVNQMDADEIDMASASR